MEDQFSLEDIVHILDTNAFSFEGTPEQWTDGPVSAQRYEVTFTPGRYYEEERRYVPNDESFSLYDSQIEELLSDSPPLFVPPQTRENLEIVDKVMRMHRILVRSAQKQSQDNEYLSSHPFKGVIIRDTKSSDQR